MYDLIGIAVVIVLILIILVNGYFLNLSGVWTQVDSYGNIENPINKTNLIKVMNDPTYQGDGLSHYDMLYHANSPLTKNLKNTTRVGDYIKVGSVTVEKYEPPFGYAVSVNHIGTDPVKYTSNLVGNVLSIDGVKYVKLS